MSESLSAFLNRTYTAFHAAENLAGRLSAEGYTALYENEEWHLSPGGKYYTVRGGSSLIAFRLPEGRISGFQIAAAHGDSPVFVVKTVCEGENGVRLGVERYGSGNCPSFMDRPLKLAGRLIFRTEAGLTSRAFCLPDPVVIPSVAIHMEHENLLGRKNNPAVDFLPLYGEKNNLEERLAAAADGAEIVARDMFLVPATPAFVWGSDGEYISSPRLDDLQCVYALTEGFLRAAAPVSAVPVLAVFDNEEVGNTSPQGANSTFLSDTVDRIADALCDGEEEGIRVKTNSFMISADNAHAVHPNHPEYADAQGYSCRLNGGIVIKHNASRQYATDAYSEALFREICRLADVPVQEYTNRADMPGGRTLGNISASRFSIPTVDIGLAQLSMHSALETAGTRDTDALIAAAEKYYSLTLQTKGGVTVWQ